ncbi:MAG: peptidoglycan editing factor PgeF [Candidatus Limnocylindrales bacterium]
MTIVPAVWTEQADQAGLLRSPALSRLGLVAGFTTRSLGSMAGGVYPLDAQARNREDLARSLGFDRVVRVKQVHGGTVLHADAVGEPWPEADALWTATRGLLLGVAAADCVPVLLADPDIGIVGAAHAGWQGTSRRVVQGLVAALVATGAKPDRLVAAIGPSIGPCCYSIDEARAATIRERLGADAADALQMDAAGRIVFDLWAANALQLAHSGVRSIERADLCTQSGGADIWSHRGEGGRNGTGLGVIGLPR